MAIPNAVYKAAAAHNASGQAEGTGRDERDAGSTRSTDVSGNPGTRRSPE